MDLNTQNSPALEWNQAPTIGAYTDYRKFLKDYYEHRRRLSAGDLRPYSYATFAASANIKSPNYLRLIIEGARNLSTVMARKFAKAMQLSKEESDEFELLVLYGQTKEPLDRNRRLKDLNDFRVKRQLKSGEIKAEAFEKVHSWVTWVLHALADQEGVSFQEERLFEILKSKASTEEIRRSLKKLIDSGELVKDEQGELKKGRRLMSGAEEVPIALVRKIQAELIYLGLESLYHDEPQDREFGAMTVSLTEKEFEHLKFELRQLRKRLNKDFMVSREQSKGDRVFQLNIQLFPLSQKS